MTKGPGSKNSPAETQLGELRRGTIVLAVLFVTSEPAYGYSLVRTLQELGLEVERNTLYPLLRRLEGQGLLESSWNTDEARPRKFYRVTAAGRVMRRALEAEWQRMQRVMSPLLTTKRGKR